jgi:hypothetical protein
VPGTPEILATQEIEIRRIRFKASPSQIVSHYLKKIITKKGWQSGWSARVPA